MKDFARLETGPFGQVLATMRRGDEGPEVTVRISSLHGVDPTFSWCFDDDDTGWEDAERALADVDLQEAGLKLEATTNGIFSEKAGAA